MTARLHALVDSAYPLVLTAEAGLTVTLDVTLPDLTAGAPVALVETLGDGEYVAAWTPSIAGVYTLTVDSAGSTVDGLEIDVVVSARLPLGAPTGGYQDHDPATGARVAWPCPNLASLPCIGVWTADQVARWAEIATLTVFDETCRRFPGTSSYAAVRPMPAGCCETPAGWGFDLWPTLRYPALELVGVTVDGTPLADLAGWVLYGRRYLVPPPSVAWPTQDSNALDGDPDTWSVVVRYGRTPPSLAVAARDRLLLTLLVENEPSTSGDLVCQLPNGVTALTENGRTITLTADAALSASSALLEESARRWKCRRANQTGIFDPAESRARGASTALVVPGDPTPPAFAAFALSGCDLAAQLAALA